MENSAAVAIVTVISALGGVFSLPACGGRQHGQASRPPEEFCVSIVAGDLKGAGESAHAAIVAGGAESSHDATEVLAAWLADQSCVSDVHAPSEAIRTEPAIREIELTLRPGSDGLVRRCHADLRLAPGARVGIHPSNWNSTNPDPRCTVVPSAALP